MYTRLLMAIALVTACGQESDATRDGRCHDAASSLNGLETRIRSGDAAQQDLILEAAAAVNDCLGHGDRKEMDHSFDLAYRVRIAIENDQTDNALALIAEWRGMLGKKMQGVS